MKTKDKLYKVTNSQTLSVESIPIYEYLYFKELIANLMTLPENHIVNYFGFKAEKEIKCIACIANDIEGNIVLLSHIYYTETSNELQALSAGIPAFQAFEREIHENFGVKFKNHPWLKPLRFAHNRANKNISVADYPFYSIESEELHEVGVGPIHAGIIEPGHFRFICNGENVLHLEIQLGWQHRGLEKLIVEKHSGLQKNIISENICGDTVIGHTIAHAQLIESLSASKINQQLNIERAIALELERIAIHVGDISALCTDVAYHLGSNVFSVLRTGIINFTQSWCGNRFGKGLIKTGGTRFPLTENHRNNLITVLDDFEKRFTEMAHLTFHLPSLENRFDNIGTISNKQARLLGSVGMAARMTNVERDIRSSHPSEAYQYYRYKTITLPGGDVFARFLLRKEEIYASINWIKNVLKKFTFDDSKHQKPNFNLALKPNSFSISLCEGWRGEICHTAITDDEGKIIHYKIKDPSIHNWKSLEISLRNLEISDFPINNKSYNLSYCAHDL